MSNGNEFKPAFLIKDFQAKQYSDLEFESPEKMSQLQDKLLSDHIKETVRKSPYYRALFKQHQLDGDSIQGISDLKKLPCTSKEDISRNNDDFVAASGEEISDICLTSATTSKKPTAVYQSLSDLSRLAYNEEAAFNMIGINRSDTVMVCAALDRCFMAGLAYYMGGLKKGATMVRAGSGSAAQQWQLIKRTQPTVLVGVPSLMRKIGDVALESGEKPDRIGIKKLVAIGEPLRDKDLNLMPAYATLETLWKARLYSTYASTEMATTFCECEERQGGHLRPELMVVEILDDDQKPVAAGDTGEVVVTPLGVTGMPLIRFQTGDISFLIEEACRCGRTSPRLGPVLGRKNHMLKLKGTTVFPSSILSVLEGIEGVTHAYIEAGKNTDGTDRVISYVSVGAPSPSPEMMAETLRAHIRVVPEIKIISAEEATKKIFPLEKRKKVTFFDLR